MPLASNATVFRMVLPIHKAHADADGGAIEHVGIASTAASDLEGDIIHQELVLKSYDVLERYGKFNWDHHSEDIGDVLGCRLIDADEAMDRFGLTITKSGTAVWGNVYPLVNASLASADLRAAHHRLLAKARLGYSLDGVATRKSTGEIMRMFVPRIAITPQPVQMETFCQRVAKSLSELAADIGMDEGELPDILNETPGPPTLLVDGGWQMGKALGGVDSDRVLMSKALVEALVRTAFGPRNAPPLGGLFKALTDIGARRAAASLKGRV